MRLLLALALVAAIQSHAWAMSRMNLPANYPSPETYADAALFALFAALAFMHSEHFFRSQRTIKALWWGATALLFLSLPAYALDSDGTEPDPVLTPGAVETQDVDVICHHRTTERRHATTAEKNAVYKAYGLPTHHSGWCAASGCDLDDRVPIECGGQNVPANLWPQSKAGAYNQADKNRLEGLCKKLVCQGKITPAEGQAWFLGDWKAEYDRRFGAIKGQ